MHRIIFTTIETTLSKSYWRTPSSMAGRICSNAWARWATCVLLDKVDDEPTDQTLPILDGLLGVVLVSFLLVIAWVQCVQG
jgi:hypothetical protein